VPALLENPQKLVEWIDDLMTLLKYNVNIISRKKHTPAS
jgi:hypothetical protein